MAFRSVNSSILAILHPHIPLLLWPNGTSDLLFYIWLTSVRQKETKPVARACPSFKGTLHPRQLRPNRWLQPVRGLLGHRLRACDWKKQHDFEWDGSQTRMHRFGLAKRTRNRDDWNIKRYNHEHDYYELSGLHRSLSLCKHYAHWKYTKCVLGWGRCYALVQYLWSSAWSLFKQQDNGERHE